MARVAARVSDKLVLKLIRARTDQTVFHHPGVEKRPSLTC